MGCGHLWDRHSACAESTGILSGPQESSSEEMVEAMMSQAGQGAGWGLFRGQPFPVRWVWKGGQYWPDEGEPGLGGGQQQTCQEVSSPDSAPDSGRAGCPQSNAFSALQQMIS